MTEKKEIKAVDSVKETERKIELPNGDVVDLYEYLAILGNEIFRIGRAVG